MRKANNNYLIDSPVARYLFRKKSNLIRTRNRHKRLKNYKYLKVTANFFVGVIGFLTRDW